MLRISENQQDRSGLTLSGQGTHGFSGRAKIFARSPMKTERLLEDIKSGTDIVDFISGYVQLKKSGQNWKGLCPFHQEKTPSFMVNPSKQIFHCFGCGAGGDVITFLLKHDSLSFHEAVSLLARKAGIALDPEKLGRKNIQKEELIRTALNKAATFFAGKLQESKAAGAYFKERKVSPESVDLFQLGYAPAGWNNLLNYMRKSGFRDEILKEAGLAVSGNKGLYDMFRERMIFPIRSINGNVVAFGGRALDDSLPKYINSPETAVFRKSEALYGLHTGKDAIRSKGFVIIVEGYMDVIICFQHGFQNVVAPLGTSLTAGHLQRLRKMTDTAVIVFDGDTAGINAARRSIPLLCQNNFRARMLSLPGNEDPDSFLVKNGSEAFAERLEKAQSIIDFLFSISRGSRAETVREVLSIIAQNLDPLAADEMLIEVSGKTRINEVTLREEFRKIKGRSSVSKAVHSTPASIKGNREEYLLLSAVVHFPEKLDEVLSKLDIGDIRDKIVASLFKRISDAEDRASLRDILEGADEEERSVFTGLLADPGFDIENVDRNVSDCLLSIEKKKFEEKFRMAELSGDLKLFNELLMEKKKRVEGKGI
jgi:DNA primase